MAGGARQGPWSCQRMGQVDAGGNRWQGSQCTRPVLKHPKSFPVERPLRTWIVRGVGRLHPFCCAQAWKPGAIKANPKHLLSLAQSWHASCSAILVITSFMRYPEHGTTAEQTMRSPRPPRGGAGVAHVRCADVLADPRNHPAPHPGWQPDDLAMMRSRRTTPQFRLSNDTLGSPEPNAQYSPAASL